MIISHKTIPLNSMSIMIPGKLVSEHSQLAVDVMNVLALSYRSDILKRKIGCGNKPLYFSLKHSVAIPGDCVIFIYDYERDFYENDCIDYLYRILILNEDISEDIINRFIVGYNDYSRGGTFVVSTKNFQDMKDEFLGLNKDRLEFF